MVTAIKKMTWKSPVFPKRIVRMNEQVRWECPKCGNYSLEKYKGQERCIYSWCGYKG